MAGEEGDRTSGNERCLLIEAGETGRVGWIFAIVTWW
jgi:hypothetical protein